MAQSPRPPKPRSRSKPKTSPPLTARTPIAEWIAAGLGAVLTLAVLGYTVWEGVTADDGPPRLSVASEPAVATPRGHVLPIVVRNDSHATAAQVAVRARLVTPDGVVEDRRARFDYVPGRGEARGGLVFQADPARSRLDLTVDGYADP